MNKNELIVNKIKSADKEIKNKMFTQLAFTVGSSMFLGVGAYGTVKSFLNYESSSDPVYLFLGCVLGAATAIVSMCGHYMKTDTKSDIIALKTNRMYLQNMLDIENVIVEEKANILSLEPTTV